jgi:hypothetical protein
VVEKTKQNFINQIDTVLSSEWWMKGRKKNSL